MAKAETKEQKAQLPDLTNFQVKYVPAGEMQKVKEKPTKPINPLAQRVAAELLKNPQTGARFELNTPVLQQARAQFKSTLTKGLRRVAQREKKDFKVRCVSLTNELIFYYEPKKANEETDDKQPR